jgi:DNA recombination protein RmuC
VYLSEGKNFVIDAKATLNSYIDYVNEQDDAERTKHWKKFVDATRAHIDELSKMGYNKIVDDKFDFVCMFMPFEHAYIDLMAREKDIYKYAFEKNIAIVTPSLLLPMLRTIDTLMRVEKQNRSVKQAIDLIEKMKDSYVGFLEEYEKVGKKISSLKVDFDDAKKKLDGRQGVSGYMKKVIEISKAGGKKRLPSFEEGEED